MEIKRLIESERWGWRQENNKSFSYDFMLDRMKFWLNRYRDPFINGYKKRICQMVGTISFNLSLNNEDTQTKRS